MSKLINNNHEKSILTFLESNDLKTIKLEPIKQDASSRRYFRIQNNQNILLMDSKALENNNYEYINISNYLNKIGLSAPKIIKSDHKNGLFLIEDFGNLTFNEALKRNISERLLYMNATKCLSTIHKNKITRKLPVYNNKYLLAELSLFTEWFFKEINIKLDIKALTQWEKSWIKIFKNINQNNNKLVLKDFHADNLFWLPNRIKLQRVGLIDFQDALIGHAAYDISSLLEDVRRKVSNKTKNLVIHNFIETNNIIDEKGFIKNYNILTAQRNAKIVGIFIRLARRDHKINYLKWVNKAMKVFIKACKEANLDEILIWLDKYIPKNKLYINIKD